MEQLLTLQARIKHVKPTDNRQTDADPHDESIETSGMHDKQNLQNTETALDEQDSEKDDSTIVIKSKPEKNVEENIEETTTIEKPKTKTASKKIKNLRFQDDIVKKPTNHRKGNKDKSKEDEKKDKEKKDEKENDHVNPYMDEWLGRKKIEVDDRYKPGKPPPNRFLIIDYCLSVVCAD